MTKKKHREDSYYTCLKCECVYQGFGYKIKGYATGMCKDCGSNSKIRFTKDFKEGNE